MSGEIHLGDGISLKACRTDIGLAVPLYRASLLPPPLFEYEEETVKIPADITGYNALPQYWIVLQLVALPFFLLTATGDSLAVRRTREPRNGQIAIIKEHDLIIIRRVFRFKDGVVLRSFDYSREQLVSPAVIDVRGTIEGIALEGYWHKLVTTDYISW